MMGSIQLRLDEEVASYDEILERRMMERIIERQLKELEELEKMIEAEGDLLTIYFDGGCISNPGGLGAWAYVIYKNGQRIHYDYGLIPNTTNNWAEYTALEKAMEFIVEHDIQGAIHVKGDSQLVIQQMKGEWRAYSNTSEHFIPRIKRMIEGRNVKFSWIPREENSEADKLTRIALREYFKNNR